MRIACVIPTCREKQIKKFLKVWDDQFKKHDVGVVIIHDGDDPWIEYDGVEYWKCSEFMRRDKDLITNRSSGIRNLGFAFINSDKDLEFVISLDDDLEPVGDTIGDHLKALNQRVPISWMPIGSEYTRGFPYGVREEAEVVLSCGVWDGMKDYDAPTQLTRGNPDMEFYKITIPRGIYAPICGMNVAFKKKALPYMYWAPRYEGVDRFDDIFMGITAKREFDKKNWAIVTGYAKVKHDRLSNPFKNLQKEALGLELNETFWHGDEKHPYFKKYRENLKRWRRFLKNN